MASYQKNNLQILKLVNWGIHSSQIEQISKPKKVHDRFNSIFNRQFYQQEKMFSKNKAKTIEPIIKSLSNRNINNHNAKPKRSVSLRPILSCKVAPPTAPTDLLPPIKSTIEVQKPRRETLREIRGSSKSKGNFDDRILSSKRRIRETSNVILGKSIVGVGNEGLSREALFQRKESHLNAYFNQRKNRLKEITHENKRIYVKINSQKSLYSSRELNKSTDSNCGLSRRMSHSKISQQSSRRSVASRESQRGKGKVLQLKRPKEIRIESLSINRVESSQINRYLTIFCNNVALKQNLTEKKLDFIDKRGNKENRDIREMSKLQKIVEEFNQRPKRKNPLFLARLL